MLIPLYLSWICKEQISAEKLLVPLKQSKNLITISFSFFPEFCFAKQRSRGDWELLGFSEERQSAD